MNAPHFSARFGASLLSLALLLGAGCAQGGPKGTKTSCVDYATKICKGVGEDSPSCQQFKQMTDLLPADACAAGLAKADETLKKLGEKRKACATLEQKLCADIGEKTQTCEMVKRETKNFPPERCDMMMQHYAEVLGDLKKQEEKNKPLSAEQTAKIATADAPAFGPADAKVTVVEFSDFQCPFCSRAASVAHQVKEKYSDKVRFVFRQFPLSFHQNAHQSAEAALAANAEGKFWEYHDKLFANQQQLDRASLEKYAQELGLNMSNFKKALDDKSFSGKVDEDFKLGQEVFVEGTPSMFVNGARVDNPTDFAALSKQIDEALKAAGG